MALDENFSFLFGFSSLMISHFQLLIRSSLLILFSPIFTVCCLTAYYLCFLWPSYYFAILFYVIFYSLSILLLIMLSGVLFMAAFQCFILFLHCIVCVYILC